MLDVVRLRVLAAVAEHGSVTAAARALNYSQPSVSHHLARLEAEVGVRLTQRVGRGLRLTPEGLLLAQRGAEVVGRVESAEREVTAMAQLHTGRVRVAGYESALSTLVAPAAAQLSRAHPGIEFSLVDLHPELALPRLQAGELDAVIGFRYDDELPEGVRCVRLLDDPMCLLSLEAGQTLADHRDSTWIAGCELCRRDFERACAAVGFVPRIAYVSDDIIVEQALVAAGLGVTTSPRMALRSHHAEGVVATELADFRRRVYVATYGDPPDAPATAAFVAALRDVVDRDQRRPDAGTVGLSGSGGRRG